MLTAWSIALVGLAYVLGLFAIAYYVDRRAREGQSLIDSPVIYSLSLAVYCTSWTFYGSVGRAVASGAGFLPIYLGPTLMALTWWFVLRKTVRIAKANSITYPSLSDESGVLILALQGKAPTVPTTLVLDRTGRIAARVNGEVTASTLTGLVDDVLAEN